MTDSPPATRIATNGITLAVHLAGPEDGQPLILAHGWPELAWSWKNQIGVLAEAGYPDGFEIQMDTLNQSPYPEIAQAVQGTLAQAGIKVDISTAEGKTLWPMYRARKHQLILAQWSPDYTDPHSNLDAFAHNPDNSPEAKLTGVLAWRNAWMDEDMNAMVVAARNETDTAKRETLYHDIQAKLMHEGPYAIMFQQTEQAVMRAEVEGFASDFLMQRYWPVTTCLSRHGCPHLTGVPRWGVGNAGLAWRGAGRKGSRCGATCWRGTRAP